MSLFSEMLEPIKVYRQTIPDGGFSEPTWGLVATIQGFFEPVSGSQEYKNDQNAQGISENCFLDIKYKGVVLPDDGIVSLEGRQFISRGFPENWTQGRLPYVMLKLEAEQFPIEV